MSQENEMYEGVEQLIKDLLKKYENMQTYTDCEEYRREGAIGALEGLLEMLNS